MEVITFVLQDDCVIFEVKVNADAPHGVSWDRLETFIFACLLNIYWTLCLPNSMNLCLYYYYLGFFNFAGFLSLI